MPKKPKIVCVGTTPVTLRFACDMFIVGADLSDSKTGSYDIIREYVKPIPR